MNREKLDVLLKRVVQELKEQAVPNEPCAMVITSVHEADCVYKPEGPEAGTDAPQILMNLYRSLEVCTCSPNVHVRLEPLGKVRA
jgi:hypothetical protein